MKPVSKLKSSVCISEVMVIRGSGLVVECGGAPMAEDSPAEKGAPSADFSAGTQMGKRYVDEAGNVELLCVKAGTGSLSIDGKALQLKDAKPLPSSD